MEQSDIQTLRDAANRLRSACDKHEKNYSMKTERQVANWLEYTAKLCEQGRYQENGPPGIIHALSVAQVALKEYGG